MPERMQKLLNTLASVKSGASFRYQPELQEIADTLTPSKECKSFNKAPLDLVYSLAFIAAETKVSGVKNDFKISKQDVIGFNASFTDYNEAKVNPLFYGFVKPCNDVICKIEQIYKTENRPVGVSEQLRIALSHTENNLSLAVITLAILTRQMARARENILLPNVVVNNKRMLNWKKCVKPFGIIPGDQDSAGDTYHLWGEMLAGMSCGEMCDHRLVRTGKAELCGAVHKGTAMATEILRYKMFGNNGKTHNKIDRLGFEIGIIFSDITKGVQDYQTTNQMIDV